MLLALHPGGGRPRGDGWTRCGDQRAAIQRWLADGLRLTKIRKLLARQGVLIAYPTLHRFAVLELQFGRTATTIPVLDGESGSELQVDTGWVGWLTLPLISKRRRFRGGRSIDPADYPIERSVYALRNVDALRRQAASAGEAVGHFAAALLDSPLPWTRMRRVYALLGLVRCYGAARVNEVCVTALAADMLDVRRLQRMLELASATPPPSALPSARILPLARY